MNLDDARRRFIPRFFIGSRDQSGNPFPEAYNNDILPADIDPAILRQRLNFRELCQDSFDTLHMVEGLRRAWLLGKTGRQENYLPAREFVGEVDRYISHNLLIKKLLPFPSIVSPEEDFKVLDRMLEDLVSHGFASDPLVSLSIREFMGAVRGGIQKVKGRQVPPDMSVVAVTMSRHRKNERAEAVVRNYNDLMNSLLRGNSYGGWGHDGEQLRIHERHLEILREMVGIQVPGMPNPYTTTMNGTSISRIVEEHDPSRFVNRVMQFLHGLPLGDYFWPRLAEGMFFNTSAQMEVDNVETYFTNKDLARRLFYVQCFMAEKLFHPSLLQTPPDGRFDRDLKVVLDRTDRTFPFHLLYSTVMGACVGYYRARMLHPDAETEEVLKAYPFFHPQVLQRDPVMPIPRAVAELFQKNKAAIQQDLASRFGATEKGRQLAEAFGSLDSLFEYKAAFSERSLRQYESVVPERTRGLLRSEPTFIADQTAQAVRQGLRSAVVGMTRLNTGVVRVEFDMATMPGLQHILINPNPYADGSHGFCIAVKKGDTFGGFGRINRDGRVRDLAITDEPQYEVLRRVTELIATRGFAAYRESLVAQPSQSVITEDSTTADKSRVQRKMAPERADAALRDYLDK